VNRLAGEKVHPAVLCIGHVSSLFVAAIIKQPGHASSKAAHHGKAGSPVPILRMFLTKPELFHEKNHCFS
jgi:hypothetical protein